MSKFIPTPHSNTADAWTSQGDGEPDTFPAFLDFLLDKSLTLTARQILLLMERRARGSRLARVTVAELAAHSGVNLRNTKRAVAGLAASPYVIARGETGFGLAGRPDPAKGDPKTRYVLCPWWLPTAPTLEVWQRHALLFIASCTRRHDDGRDVSIERIHESCSVPGRHAADRRRSARGLIDRMSGAGVLTLVRGETNRRPAVYRCDLGQLPGVSDALPRGCRTLSPGGVACSPPGVSDALPRGCRTLSPHLTSGTPGEHPVNTRRTPPAVAPPAAQVREVSSIAEDGDIPPITATTGDVRVQGGGRAGIKTSVAHPPDSPEETTVPPDHHRTPGDTPGGPEAKDTARTEAPPVQAPPLADQGPVAAPAAEGPGPVGGPGKAARRPSGRDPWDEAKDALFGRWGVDDVRAIERAAGLAPSVIGAVRLAVRLNTRFPAITKVSREDVTKIASHDCWELNDRCLATLLEILGFVERVREYSRDRREKESSRTPEARWDRYRHAPAVFNQFQLLPPGDPCRLPLEPAHALACLYLRRHGEGGCSVERGPFAIKVSLPRDDSRVEALRPEWLAELESGGAPSLPPCLRAEGVPA